MTECPICGPRRGALTLREQLTGAIETPHDLLTPGEAATLKRWAPDIAKAEAAVDEAMAVLAEAEAAKSAAKAQADYATAADECRTASETLQAARVRMSDLKLRAQQAWASARAAAEAEPQSRDW